MLAESKQLTMGGKPLSGIELWIRQEIQNSKALSIPRSTVKSIIKKSKCLVVLGPSWDPVVPPNGLKEQEGNWKERLPKRPMATLMELQDFMAKIGN